MKNTPIIPIIRPSETVREDIEAAIARDIPASKLWFSARVLREHSERLKVEFLDAFRTSGGPASEIGFLTAAGIASAPGLALYPSVILALGAIESAADYVAIASEEQARHDAAERAQAARAAVLARRLQLEQGIEADPELNKLRERAASVAS